MTIQLQMLRASRAFIILSLAAIAFVSSSAHSQVPITRPVYSSGLSFSEDAPARFDVGEYEPLGLPIRGETPILMGINIVRPSLPVAAPARLQVKVLNRPMVSGSPFVPPPAPKTTLVLPALPPGEYVIELWVVDEVTPRDSRPLHVVARYPRLSIQPVADDGTGRMTLALSDTWIRRRFGLEIPLADRFTVWSAESNAVSPLAVPVHLFTNGGTHPALFFTARPEEISALRKASGWIDEGVQFRAVLPTNGACMNATIPVYRAFQVKGVATHLHTAEATAYAQLARSGDWIGEGIAFCALRD